MSAGLSMDHMQVPGFTTLTLDEVLPGQLSQFITDGYVLHAVTTFLAGYGSWVDRGWTVGGFMSACSKAQPGGLYRARRILDCSGRHRELCPSLQGGHNSLKLFQGAILRGNDEVSTAECHLSPKSPPPDSEKRGEILM
ncbi:hypothetical protein I7I51_05978 [Histoplasma capsulatum]|uniref:Uncharacterized protein n=1 Tax=Ajellomyces capsulatus TaxID=5037 RepID=A0A8A1MF61_AJECA|nr:hypothetical protein I7I51_05978 [Histoplasma capsulatum]